ncbi:MAG: MFS transporter [Actinobacteria bacterium]|nr:MAG: MFS transporter [Actinomycetota bacterium]
MTRSSTSPLRHRDFSLYLGSMFATGLAVQMSQVAIGWQVFHINHRPLDLGLVGLSEFVPLPLLALPAGALADRLPRRTTFAVAVGLDAAVAAGLLALTVSGPTAVWPFFVLALGTGVASALGAPPSRALTPSLVPAEILTRAMAVRSVAFEISAIAGPALGGVLFYLRPELVYEVSTALSAGSLLCVLAIRSGREPASGEAPTLDSVFDGLRLIRRTPVMLGAISLDLFAVLFGGAVALLPVYASDVLHVGKIGLGVLRSAPAVGALVAAVLLARRPVGRFAGRKLLLVVTAFGVCMIVFGLSHWMWLSLLALAVSGGVDLVSVVLRASILPLVTPDNLRGRVNAVEMVFISASNELGAFESGVAAALVGAVPAVVAGGVATIVVAAAWSRLFPPLANVDRIDELQPFYASPGLTSPDS